MALVLTLREGDEVHIGNDIVLRAAEFKGRQVRLAIDAPRDQQIGHKKKKYVVPKKAP